MTYQLYATMASGIESITAKELQHLGYETRSDNGRVYFEGDGADIAKANLWLRSADRVKIVIGQFEAKTFDDLFEQVKALPWDEFLPLDAAFPVAGRSVRSTLHSEPDVQAITKKAIVDKLSTVYHRRTRLAETGATYPLEVSILKDVVTISLDTTGPSLFKRGYRLEKGDAPLKENFAAALVLLSRWQADMPFVDPTTGSGTIAIEAALIGHNIAPGMHRQFAFEAFDWIAASVLETAKAEAKAAVKVTPLEIFGYDIDQNMIDIAKLNANEAGVLHDIQFKQLAVKDFKTDLTNGVIIANPPYGKRLSDQTQARALYKEMGNTYRPLKTWSKYILTSDLQFQESFGQRATKRRKLYNGRIQTDLFQYWGRPVWPRAEKK
ncbi:THUMP domain-containing class I SAM-dependent RNA methyltransferase [Latilactobacillus fragifolii]|uniref:THUMP domain-containing class I SAM-dependent RNA methyltransferase n=1 Tax=Latilactobacillus fragifolii TaxID=2814244 RepID=UPI001ABAF110|nr:class I SAM-dependent RNA methyltransferase [Latilactobacillus fragifolii]